MSIDSASYIPIYMYNISSGQPQSHKLILVEKAIADYESGENTSINSSTYNNLKNALTLTKNILGETIE